MKRWLRTSQLARAQIRGASEAGYTIIETLIVLAVTTMMFVTVALFFSGRQAKTEFQQAVRNYEASVETIISEVVNGHYISYTCTALGSGTPSVTSSPSPSSASNEACIFVGKTLQIIDPTNESTEVSTLVGRRTLSDTNKRDVESILEAKPVISSAATASFDHSFNLEVRRMARISNNTTVEAIGFTKSFSRSVTTGGGSADLVKLYSTGVAAMAPGGVVDLVNFTEATGGIIICLVGQNDQRAEITVGASGNPTSLVSTLNTQSAGQCNV